MTKKRTPRPPVAPGLPAFAEFEETLILETIEHWYGLIAAVLGSEAGQLAVQGDLARQLNAGDAAALSVACIVAMADAGHPPADHALRGTIHAAIDADRFGELPVQVRAYAQRALLRPPAQGYPSNANQVVNNFVRDIAVPFLIDQLMLRWPAVPKLYSSGHRHSAAWFVSEIFSRHGRRLSERQARRIYAERHGVAERLARFMLNRPNGEGPFGR